MLPAAHPLRRLLRATLALFAVVLVFGGSAGLWWYFGGERLLLDRPSSGFDFDTHITQTWRVLEGLRGWGRTWVWDVQHLAGVPNGVIFDADNKGWELWTHALTSLGVPQGLTFNLFTVLAHLMVAPVVYASARLFGLGRRASLLAAGLGVLYWYFDSWNHWVWFVGMVSYAFAGYLFLLPLAAFYRWMADRRPIHALLTAGSMALCHLVHPYSFFILVVPMAVLYLRRARELSRAEHVVVWGIAATTLAVNGYWLHNALQFWHYILDSAFFADPTLDSLVWDVFGLIGDPAAQGVVGNRTGFRLLLIAGAVAGLWAMARRSDARALPLGLGLLFLVLLTYLGGYTVFANIQPRRHVGPTGFLAIIPAAVGLELAFRERWWSRMPRPAWALIAVLSIPAAQHLSRDVLYFTVRSLPKPSPLPDGQPIWYTMLGYGPHGDFSYADWHHDELADWIRAHDDGSARFVVDNWHLGEQLAWKTDAQILGGFTWRNLQHSWANFHRRYPEGLATAEQLREYLQTYGARWVIVSTPHGSAPWWEQNSAVELVTSIEHVRIYRAREPVSLLAEGHGHVRADTNGLLVTGSDPTRDVVLRYHWMETLACGPDCQLEREPIDEVDRVGFIRVPAPHPADFEIRNMYRRMTAPPEF